MVATRRSRASTTIIDTAPVLAAKAAPAEAATSPRKTRSGRERRSSLLNGVALIQQAKENAVDAVDSSGEHGRGVKAVSPAKSFAMSQRRTPLSRVAAEQNMSPSAPSTASPTRRPASPLKLDVFDDAALRPTTPLTTTIDGVEVTLPLDDWSPEKSAAADSSFLQQRVERAARLHLSEDHRPDLTSVRFASKAMDIIESVLSPQRFVHRRRESLGDFLSSEQQATPLTIEAAEVAAEVEPPEPFFTPVLLRITNCERAQWQTPSSDELDVVQDATLDADLEEADDTQRAVAVDISQSPVKTGAEPAVVASIATEREADRDISMHDTPTETAAESAMADMTNTAPTMAEAAEPEPAPTEDLASTPPQGGRKKRSSRRLSYLSATRSAQRDREAELQQCTDAQRRQDLQDEAQPCTLVPELPGSVERKRRTRRSTSLTRTSLPRKVSEPVATERVSIQPVEATISLEESLSTDADSRPTSATIDEAVVPSVAAEPTQDAPAAASSMDDVFSDFMANWKSKKSQKAKQDPDSSSSPSKAAPNDSSPSRAVATPRRVPVGVMSPVKMRQLVAAVPSSVQKVKKNIVLKPRLPSPPRLARPDSTSRTEPTPRDTAPRPAALVSPIRVAVASERKREAPEAASNRAKKSKIVVAKPPVSALPVPAARSALPQPVAGRATRALSSSTAARVPATTRPAAPTTTRKRSAPVAATPAPIARPPSRQGSRAAAPTPAPAPTTPAKSISLSAAELTKQTRDFTAQNRIYRCDFDRQVVRRDGPRPTSPTAKRQTEIAAKNRSRRRRLSKSRGWTFGAGDDDDWNPALHCAPLDVAPRAEAVADRPRKKKAVTWDEQLETDLHVLPRTSPTEVARQFRLHKRKPAPGTALFQVELDELGNLPTHRRAQPLTPDLGRAQKVTILKVLYKGEQDE